MKCQFLAIDAGRQTIALIDTANPRYGWSRSLAKFPNARDIQRIGQNRVLIAYEHGFFELTISSGEIPETCGRWSQVSSVWHLPNGATLVAGRDLDGAKGINIITLDREYRPVTSIRRDGDYVGSMRPTASGTYLLCMRDHILETDRALVTLRTMRAPGFEQPGQVLRLADGGTLASAGGGAFMARFDARGYLTATFGNASQVPDDVTPTRYTAFQRLADGRVVVANPGGGLQLLEFTADGRYQDGWSDPQRVTSLQAMLLL
jgi:hypothetical protein